MRRVFTTGLLAATFFALSAAAQQDWYRDRLNRFKDEHWKGHIFESVRSDLEHINSAFHASDKERNRLERTRQELADLQDKWDHNRWDNGEVNDVLDSLRKSSNDQRLSPRDRDVLTDDVRRIQEAQGGHNNRR